MAIRAPDGANKNTFVCVDLFSAFYTFKYECCVLYLSVCLLGMTGGIQASRNVSGQLSQRTAANHSQNEHKCFLPVFLHLFARLSPVNRELEIHNFCSLFTNWTLQTITYFLEYYLSSDDRLWYVNFANLTNKRSIRQQFLFSSKVGLKNCIF